ncbi:MAG: OadG family protein [Pseudoflavonifractor sp.]|nr:OadG family protein [Alloprevotella sp.]MCM1117011.1 OadG family protein [Pseudoflavonifractor sp.]
MKKSIFLLLAVLIGGVASISAQARRALKINEVMVTNTNNFVDDFGERHGWIELFNSAHAPLEISSIYITTDPANPKMYAVPLGDVNTKMPKRQHVLFWTDGMPTRGTFHTSFTLKEGQDNWIGIYEADGQALIDSVTIPASLTANQSYARKHDGQEGWEVRDDANQAIGNTTPSSANVVREQNNKVEMFKQNDANGVAMAIMAMAIVFSALLILALCFLFISKLGARKMRQEKAKAHGIDPASETEHPQHDSGEEIAAIGMALYQHLNAHDTESTVLTINKVKRAYSPWSSKIYGLRELPRR